MSSFYHTLQECRKDDDMTHSILASLWRKVHGIGITNPSEVATLLRDLDNRLKSLEERYEELASDRSEADRDAGAELPIVDTSDTSRREGQPTRSKGSAPRRSK